MKSHLARTLRLLACMVGGHLPVSSAAATHCGSCGAILLSKEHVRETVDRMFEEIFARMRRGRPGASA